MIGHITFFSAFTHLLEYLSLTVCTVIHIHTLHFLCIVDLIKVNILCLFFQAYFFNILYQYSIIVFHIFLAFSVNSKANSKTHFTGKPVSRTHDHKTLELESLGEL